MYSRRVLYVILVIVLWSGGCKGSESPAEGGSASDLQPKVVVFVIDGARYTETFGDSAHAWVPRMWQDLRPLGAILTGFRNQGTTSTVPGHTSMMTGTWQVIANDGTQRPDRPTVFEYFRRTYSLPDSIAHVVSGKNKLNVCAWGTYPGYGPDYGARASVGFAGDLEVYDALVSILQNERPRLVLACLPEVDWKGHSGIWDDYTAAIAVADSLVYETWQYLQSDPFYSGQTWMFVTNDHGRHDDDNGGFKSHGDGCEGCRHLMFLALGPTIRPGFTSDGNFTQRDVCNTVGDILQFPVPLSEGGVIYDIFETIPTGTRSAPGRNNN